MTRHDVPSEFAKRLFKRPALEAAHNKEFGCFDQILLRFGFGLALSGDVQRRAMGYVPAILLLYEAKKLELRLDYFAHTRTPGSGALISPMTYVHIGHIVNDLGCARRSRVNIPFDSPPITYFIVFHQPFSHEKW